MVLTAWMLDFTPSLRLRGFLLRPAFKKCGKNFQVAGRTIINWSSNVTIGDNVFIGPHTTFTNTKYPMGYKYYLKTIVGNFAIIGANATILPGIRIGANATIGAGSVVTKSVEIGITVIGNPAIPLKYYATDCKYYFYYKGEQGMSNNWCGCRAGGSTACKCEDYEPW